MPVPVRLPPIPFLPLATLCVAVVLASVPIWSEAVFWTPGLIVAAALVRVGGEWRRLPVLPTVARIGFLAIAISAIMVKYRTFFSVEPGFGVLLVLVSLKILETRTPRDFHVLVTLGFFLGLSALFLSQDLPRWLYVGVTFALLVSAAIHLHMGGAAGRLLRSARTALALLGQALPLTLFLFIFVPRPYGEFRLFPGTSRKGIASMSDRMRPGSISSMATQAGRAFRVSFPDYEKFPPLPYYWRGLVLWDGDGLDWQRGEPRRVEARSGSAHGPPVRQHITIEPHGEHWLYALDRPVSPVKEAFYESGGTLRSLKPINAMHSYDVISNPINAERQLAPEDAAAALAPPSKVSNRVRALAESFRAGVSSDGEIVQRGLDFFRQGKFVYSYTPGTYASNELDEFLFFRRAGFCEHYAGAFASLMRIAGVPSRVVVGYLGGEESRFGRYFIVNQSDAHAWCEVWLRGQGWQRIDPTSAAAPDRVNSGLYDYLASQGNPVLGADANALNGWYSSNFLREVRLAWDGLTYQWDLRVLTFDRENQQDFFALLGLGLWHASEIFSVVAVVALLLLALLAVYLRGPGRAVLDRAQALYARFCRRLAAAGVERRPAEGPMDFAERAAERLPQRAEAIRKVGALYAAARYGREGAPIRELARAVREAS